MLYESKAIYAARPASFLTKFFYGLTILLTANPRIPIGTARFYGYYSAFLVMVSHCPVQS